jgi:hypothetical protein
MGAAQRSLFFLILFQILMEFQCIALPIEESKVDHRVSPYTVNMFALPDPARPTLKEVIFNDQLSREFRAKYVEKFGEVDMEYLTYRNSRFAELDDRLPDQASFENTRLVRKKFGEYMLNRLLEWHLDKSLKETPEMEKVYQVKQALANIQVPVTAETKIHMLYSFVDSTFEVNYLNPLVESKIKLDPVSTENQLIFSKPMNHSTTVSTIFYEKDGIASLEISRRLQKQTQATLSSSTWFHQNGTSTRETRSSIGVVYLF